MLVTLAAVLFEGIICQLFVVDDDDDDDDDDDVASFFFSVIGEVVADVFEVLI